MFHELTVVQFTKMLNNLSEILDLGAAHAEAKKFDFNVLLQSRLAPDQFPLIRQVQMTCDTAKLGVSRMTGVTAPSHPDTETTLPELKARIASVIEWLNTVSPSDFAGTDERRVTQPRWEGKSLSATELGIHHVIPNFYFHLTTTYAILRHNGVDVGKKNYLGPMPFRAAEAVVA